MDSILSLIYGLQRGYNSRSAERSAAPPPPPLLQQQNFHISQYFRQPIADSRVQLGACLHLKMILKRNEYRDRLHDCRTVWVIMLHWTNQVAEILTFLCKFTICQQNL